MLGMKHYFQQHWIIMTFVLLLGAFDAPIHADVTVTDPAAPIQVELQNALDTKIHPAGKPFVAVLKENYRFNGKVVPAWTKFEGEIADLKTGRRFGREGWMSLKVNAVVFPNGKRHDFAWRPEEYQTELEDAGKKTRKKESKRNLPVALSRVGATVGATVVGVAALPVSLGVGAAVATRQEFKDDETHDRTVGQKVKKGLWRGTGIPGFLHFVKKSPSPRFEVGQMIELHLGPSMTQELFTAAPNFEG
ncbi:MAG: hypothetical protein KTR14_09725 [Vampirovibrio sp.]|nr:hypothetical protein [Vampirovibrio sp.]